MSPMHDETQAHLGFETLGPSLDSHMIRDPPTSFSGGFFDQPSSPPIRNNLSRNFSRGIRHDLALKGFAADSINSCKIKKLIGTFDNDRVLRTRS